MKLFSYEYAISSKPRMAFTLMATFIGNVALTMGTVYLGMFIFRLCMRLIP